MKKFSVVFAALVLCGCQSGAPSYYQLDSYESIVKEMDSIVAKKQWIPTNIRNVETVNDRTYGNVKLASDFYFNKQATSKKDVFNVWGRSDVTANGELFGRNLLFSEVDCKDAQNGAVKLVLQSISSVGGDKPVATKITVLKQDGALNLKGRAFSPGEVYEETNKYITEQDANKSADYEMYKLSNEFRNIVCSNN
mgnify:CR=1 FL=1